MVKRELLAWRQLSWWGVSLAVRLAADEGIGSVDPSLYFNITLTFQ
jgi:hypothetical protein